MENQQLRQLDFFVQGVLAPSIQRVREGECRLEVMVATAGMYEAVSWLDIGVHTGLFPARAASDVLLSHFPVLYEPLSMLERWEILQRTREVLLYGRDNKYFFGGVPEFNESISLSLERLFSLASLILSDHLEDIATGTLISALVFADDARWESVVSHVPSPDAILAALEEGYDAWISGRANLAYAGCFATITHLEKMMELFAGTMPGGGADTGDLIQLRLDIWAAHSWRFQFLHERYHERFRQIMHLFGRVTASQVAQATFGAAAEAFDSYLVELIKRWLRFTRPNRFGNFAS